VGELEQTEYRTAARLETVQLRDEELMAAGLIAIRNSPDDGHVDDLVDLIDLAAELFDDLMLAHGV